tara:strand:+ start:25 stop:237 length:213 start_codon:yes stop_codon:yes gene_type:complete
MPIKVVIPPSVEADIEAIGDHIAADNPRAAVATMERLRDRCLSLDHMPNRGAQYGDRYRFLVEGDYLIFY